MKTLGIIILRAALLAVGPLIFIAGGADPENMAALWLGMAAMMAAYEVGFFP